MPAKKASTKSKPTSKAKEPANREPAVGGQEDADITMSQRSRGATHLCLSTRWRDGSRSCVARRVLVRLSQAIRQDLETRSGQTGVVGTRSESSRANRLSHGQLALAEA